MISYSPPFFGQVQSLGHVGLIHVSGGYVLSDEMLRRRIISMKAKADAISATEPMDVG